MTEYTASASRRTVLGGGLAALVAAVTATGPAHAAPGEAAGRSPQSQVFTFFTDPHADPENTAQMARVKATLEAMAADQPVAALHAGDVTEYGTAAEYSAYLSAVPDSLRDRLRHVPGNHEIRWDVTAYENYQEHLEQTNQAVTVGGVQILLMDPTVVQQEVGYYSTEDLAWLARQLQSKPAHRPSVIVTHYPMAEGHYYVVNPEDLLATIEGHNVRVLLTGHTHRQVLEHFNGVAHLEGAAVKNLAQYYRLTLEEAGHRTATLTIEHVAIPDPTDPTQTTVTPVTTVDLGGQTGRNPLDPRRIQAVVDGGSLAVTVNVAQVPAGTTARASIYHQALYAGRATESWTSLGRSGPRFTGVLDVSELAPGEHRVNIELVHGDQRWREVARFTVKGQAARALWDVDLDGMITGGTATSGSRVFVPSSAGQVTAFEPTASGPGRAWTTQTGPVWTNLAVSPDGSAVVAGSANGFVTALRTADGSVLWRTRLGRPVMSDPVVSEIAGEPAVVVMAEEELVRLDADTGRIRWRVQMPGVSAGRAAADDERIYLGLGDGKAWAVDAADGSRLWQRELANRAGSYRKLIYGPWTHQVTLITPDLVFVSTVAAGRALDRSTGEIVWEIPKSFLYTPVRVLGDGDLLLVDEWGEARRVDPGTGETRWLTDRMVSRSLDAGPVVGGDVAFVVGTMGDLAEVDLRTGEYRVLRQLSVSPVVSTPSLIGGVLTVGHLDGVVRGFRVG